MKEHYTNKVTRGVEQVFQGQEWVGKNIAVFKAAKSAGAFLCGSTAIMLARKDGSKEPGDLDFVANDWKIAQNMVERLINVCRMYPCYFQVQYNHDTKFCSPNVDTHIRFKSPFWKPVCIFVLKEPSECWYIKGGLAIQQITKVVEEKTQLDIKRTEAQVSDEEATESHRIRPILPPGMTDEDFDFMVSESGSSANNEIKPFTSST